MIFASVLKLILSQVTFCLRLYFPHSLTILGWIILSFLNTKNMKDKPISSISNKSYQVEVD